jgi:ABC-type branched-subunit amino acid transport system ATPase component
MTCRMEAVGVVKRFGKTIALDGLELFADLRSDPRGFGPDGTGKTTWGFPFVVPTGFEPVSPP